MKWIALTVILVLFAGLAPIAEVAEAQGCTAPNWQTEFYNNVTFSGSPSLTVCYPYVNINWGSGIPATGIGADYFAVRWSSTQTFPAAGNYQFTLTVEDGARLYINGTLIINDTSTDATAPRTLSGTYAVSQPGATAQIVLETFHYTGNAMAQLNWAYTAPTADQPWTVTYFNNLTWSPPGVAAETAPANGIARPWNSGAPLMGVQAENWTSLWTRTVNFQAGTYTFYLRADDGAKVRIDGTEIMNQAQYSTGRTFTATVSLTAGPHTITVEHFNLFGPAYLLLTWTPAVGTNILPTGCNSVMAQVGEGAPSCGTVTNPPTTPSSITATVNTGALNVRPAPSVNNDPITVIYRNTSYPVVGRTANNLWVQLDVSGQRGWVAARFVTLNGDISRVPVTSGTVSPPVATGVQARSLGNMRIRSGPGTGYDRIGGIRWGTTVNVIGRTADNTWIQIQVGNLTGWSVRSWYEIIKGRLNDVPVTG